MTRGDNVVEMLTRSATVIAIRLFEPELPDHCSGDGPSGSLPGGVGAKTVMQLVGVALPIPLDLLTMLFRIPSMGRSRQSALLWLVGIVPFLSIATNFIFVSIAPRLDVREFLKRRLRDQ